MTERVIGPTGGRRRRWTLGFVVAAALSAGLILAVGASANLAGSSFEGNDGNLVVNTAGNTDWDNAPNLSVGIDLPTGATDNSFGQGAKENNVQTTVVDGSIPNSKADLARFAVAGETIGNNTFLYLAWSRENQNGTVNFDFEINAQAQPDLTTLGPKTLVRTVNDLLINYGFQGSSSTAALSLRKWTGTEWGPETPISSTCSEGAANTAPVLDTLGVPPASAVLRPAGQFGEAAINLVCAGVIPPQTCAPFSSAYVKSRSSTSFNSELKDFIAPVHLNLAACGSITVIKHTNPRGLDQAFSYTTTGTGLSAFSLNDAGNSGGGDSEGNTESFPNLQPGTYTVTEGDDPTGFAFNNVSCTGGANTSTAGKVATINLAADEDVVCTYVNDQQLGAIKVSKSSIKGNTALAGGVFTVAGAGGPYTLTTDSTGTACVDNLAFGNYTVTETAAPGGYIIDNPNAVNVTVSVNEGCAAASVGANLAFTDTPKTNITATADSQDDGPGGTLTTITCVNSANANVGNSPSGNVHNPSVTANDLVPGTYTCTLVIDP